MRTFNGPAYPTDEQIAEYEEQYKALTPDGLRLAQLFHRLALKGYAAGANWSDPAPVYVTIAFNLMNDEAAMEKVVKIIEGRP